VRSLALAACLGLIGSAMGAQSPTVPAAGSESPWLVAGPFPIEASTGLEDGLDKDYLREGGISSSGESRAAPLRITALGSKAAWREAPGRQDGEGLDLIATLGPLTNSVAYAYREFDSSRARQVSLKIGSDDGVKAWVNGKLVLAHHTIRPLVPDEDAVLVSLERGSNRVLVKVSQAAGDWGFTLRLVPAEEDAKAGAQSRPRSIVACPDDLSVAQGGIVGGVVMTKPAFCVEGEARVQLLGPKDEVLASGTAPIAGRFSIQAPSGYSGIARIKASGTGTLADLAPSEAMLLLGDPAAIAAEAAQAARSAAKAPTGAEASSLDAPSLEFLASLVEGKLPPPIGGFDKAAFALAELASMGADPAKERIGLARYAYRSVLDGSLQPYTLYVPGPYEPRRRYGLVVALHGAGGDDFDMASRLASARPADMLVLAPYGRGDMRYESTGERDVLDAIDLVMSRYAIDPDRVYLTGSSMGGFGTWRLAQLYPSRFAAIAPFAGWTDPDCLENVASVPALVVHGDADPTVPIGMDSAAVDRLKSLGAQVRFDVLPGAGHDALGAWTAASGPGRLFDWLRSRVRQRWPAETKLRGSMARCARGGWASILGLERPLRPAALDAKVLDDRHIAVDTQNVSAFELDLRHPSLARSGRILVIADGANLTADALSPGALFELGPDGRYMRAEAPPAGMPADEGSGLAALFRGPLRVVYGSARGRAAEEEAVAEALADWEPEARTSTGGAGRFELLPDSASSPALEAGTSVIFVGWPEDNSALARVAQRLPLAIKGGRVAIPGSKDTGRGLVLVCPNPEAPGSLMGVLALPMRGKAAQDCARALAEALQSKGSDSGLCGFGTPDATVLDSSGKPIWAASFDWRWQKLKTIEIQESGR
jgi:predicted esterase